jgi:hypothetical protein
MIDASEYEKLARETGSFQDIELDILAETLRSWAESPGDPYTLLELRDGKILAGFALFRREPGTEYSFDIRAFCVDQSYIDSGVGSRLVAIVEEEILKLEATALLRFETSTKKLAAVGETTLPGSGYSLIGHIPDFYAEGDDYYMYARQLTKAEPERGEGEKR